MPAIVEMQPAGLRPPLFILGVRQIHLRLADHLGPHRPLLGLPPSRLPVDAPIQDVARDLLAWVVERQPRGPYYLAGWCVDGLVALEMAQQLRNAGADVAQVVLLDTFVPSHEWSWMLNVKPARWNVRLRQRLRVFRQSTWRERRDDVARKAAAALRRNFRATLPGGLDATEARRRSVHLAQSYKPLPYSGRLALIRSEGGFGPRSRVLDWGWTRVAQGGLEIHQVPGDHITMFLEPHVGILGEAIERCLREPLSLSVRQ